MPMRKKADRTTNRQEIGMSVDCCVALSIRPPKHGGATPQVITAQYICAPCQHLRAKLRARIRCELRRYEHGKSFLHPSVDSAWLAHMATPVRAATVRERRA